MKPTSLRFSEPEWDALQAEAATRGLTPHTLLKALVRAMAEKRALQSSAAGPVCIDALHETWSRKAVARYTVTLPNAILPALNSYAVRNGLPKIDQAIAAAVRATLYHRGDLTPSDNFDGSRVYPDTDTASEYMLDSTPKKPMLDDRGGEP